MKQSINWAAIRTTEGEDWIDTSTISTDKEDCERQAHKTDKRILPWAKDNPIKCFARVKIKLA